MTDLFQKYLLTELHMVVYQPGNPADMTDLGLCEAVTLNENLHSLGFALKPEGIAQLAVSPTLYTFFDEVNALVPDIKVQPMYPGFPREVLEMDEAMLRFNQAMHYLSTYGVENFFGHQVSKGWLSKSDATLATRAPKRLLDLKYLDLVDEEKAAVTVLKTLFARRERLTWPELTIVLESIPCCTVEDVTEMQIRFKENVELLFPHILRMKDRKAALVGLRAICAHCGDVLRCAADYIRRQKYHLSTAEKKLFVRLLELYPVKNLRQNLIMSQRLRERNLIVLRVLDYNRFSKSEEHREAVRALRAGELLSWYGLSEKLLLEKAPNALYHLAGRPGVMLRMLNRLLELGYAPEAILEKLRPQAGFVSGQMVVKLVHEMASRETELRRKYQEDVEYWRKSFENERNTYTPESLKEHYNRDVECVKRDAMWRCCRLDWEYFRNPIYRANSYAKQWLRPFRKKCSDAEAQLLEVREILRRQESFEKETVHTLVSNAIFYYEPEIAYFLFEPNHFREEEQKKLAAFRAAEAELQEETQKRDAWLEAELQEIRSGAPEKMEQRRKEIDQLEQERLEALRVKYKQDLAKSDEQIADCDRRRDERLAALEDAFQKELARMSHSSQAVWILLELLQEHFTRVETPLKGKKVLLQMKHFALEYSELQTTNRSQDGGYVRSGISYRIPKQANYVRFFVYWNDHRRVDIDLHAGGTLLNGKEFSVSGSTVVGWNTRFKDCGLVHSGDITHSNAVEYIDIDLSAPVEEVQANIDLFCGAWSFRNVENCYVGMMAVKEPGEEVKKYSRKNCFFTHELNQNCTSLHYGYVNVQKRYVRFVGQPFYSRMNKGYGARPPKIPKEKELFSLQDYLDAILAGQQAKVVSSASKADVILTLEKNALENGISLVDNNYFLEC